jgi:hypothetical protein
MSVCSSANAVLLNAINATPAIVPNVVFMLTSLGG